MGTTVSMRKAGRLLPRRSTLCSPTPSFLLTCGLRRNCERNLACLHMSAAIHDRENFGVFSGIQVSIRVHLHCVLLYGKESLDQALRLSNQLILQIQNDHAGLRKYDMFALDIDL